MKTLFAATLMAASLFGATAAFANTPETAVQGTVQSVDLNGKTVMLTDGRTFTAAPQLSIEPLQAGEAVTFMYTAGRDGQKQLAAYWIDAGPNGARS